MKELDDVTEELNENLRRAEAWFLVGPRVMAEVWLSVEKNLRLRFGKFNGEWGLRVVHFSEKDGMDVLNLLTNASRKTRVMAAHKLEELARAIHEASEASFEEVDGAVAVVESFLLARRAAQAERKP